MPLFGAAVLSALSLGFTVALDDHTYQLLNTALQIFTIIYLSKVDAKQRREIAPKLEHVENITAALDPRIEGGRRQHDPQGE